MGQSRVVPFAVVTLALLMLATSLSTFAEEHPETYLIEDVYTEEYTTTNRDVLLEGDTVKRAYFNFTVLEDKINTAPDAFLFTVVNMDNAALTQSLPGTTDTEGRLTITLPVTLAGSPRWRITVSCTEAGDLTLGPRVIEEDNGNAWDLQIEYVYEVEGNGGGNGNGNGGNGGGDGGTDDNPSLVTIMQLNLLLVALLSIVVAFLSIGPFLSGGGSLKIPLLLAFLLVLDSFIFLPVALVVNQELNDAVVAMPPFGPAWLGNLALILMIIWAVPFILARKRVMGSDEVHNVVSHVLAKRVADSIRKRADRYPDGPLSDKMLALLMVVLGLGSLVVAALMLLA
jgi:hypothetical protein